MGDMTVTSNVSATAHLSLSLEVEEGAIAVVTFNQGTSRANTLNKAVLTELESVVFALGKRADLKGLIFRSGKPGMFIAGADLNELGRALANPVEGQRLTRRGLDLFGSFENLPFPTVVAIEGACMGGGLELALAFDYRLASTHPKTELGLPEVKIGLIPGWGGTQRLSRLIGPALAAELICAGEAVNAQRARELGIVSDAVPSERLLDEARRLVKPAQESKEWEEIRRRKRQPVALSQEQVSNIFAKARSQVLAKTKGQLPAPLAALDAIEKGCTLSLDHGLRIESEAFAPLLGSPISRNLIAVFFMTQRLQKDPGVADTAVQPKSVERVGVLGAGIMGSGIAGAHLRRGIPVALLDSVPQALEKGVAAITKTMQSRVDIGRMKPEEMASALGQLSTAVVVRDSVADAATEWRTTLADRDVVIEAVIENEAAKVDLYRQIEPLLHPDAILASNTSTISITRMAQSVKRPEQFAGMHFFNPVDRMQLVEVIRGERTSDQTVATLVALAKRIGKTPIVVRDCPGFLVNRILFPYLNESLALLEEGAEPRAIDKAATDFGMPMGPITLNDLVGLDTSLYAGKVVNTAFADRAKTTRILDELVAAGRLGQKSGAGFYNYAPSPLPLSPGGRGRGEGARGADDPAFAAILERCRTAHRKIDPHEIIDRLFLPMLVEASRVLEEKIVREPSDVDMGLILGIGFPAFHGGILRWADTLGLDKVLDKLKRYEHLGPRFHATEQIRQLAKSGQGFYPGSR
jgi:3-hydroxyacyl-CoA dehydrogenase/enoyl-CoA hydratase/3-hydroxybutyryl-CoA epimerase/3-hydroxyacyl-CoA dehydrogenase/enoyl-CoA hydratase/3-hydroxybutyryl-CoA epimerase/enoyl-CoA isomerase